MTIKSLELRTSSYGSLQLQQTNGAVQNNAPLPTSRKYCKLQVTGNREKEKERWIPFMCRYLCRRKVGMVILVCFALLAFASGLVTVNKETADRFSTNIAEAFQLPNIHESDVSGSLSSRISTNNSTKEGNHSNSQIILNKLGRSPPSAINPCKNFRFPPPPPPNNRRSGPRPCPVCYLPVEQAYASMPTSSSPSPVLRSLSYVREENPIKTELHGGSDFGGYPSLKQRSDYFDVKESMTVHCGFVKGSRPGHGSGFDIDEADLSELDKYHDIIVASAIFGNYDVIQEPVNISAIAKRNVPFYMFLDEETEEYMRNKGVLNSTKVVGIWRIIVVRNVPYSDARRNGKVPKLLLHRLFPNVRYSIWIDGKLKLLRDPYQVVERFLWRENATFAISRHYKRFDVFVEAEANKMGGKYDNASIDYQVDFYRKEGSTPYSEAKLPITSDVPEGCVIIREHIPITNLFTCQWFNEVDRFTPRDQLSFSTVRDKIMAKVNWTVNMFLDCERRNFVLQAYHRDLLEHMPPPLPRTIQHRVRRLRPLTTTNKEIDVGRATGKKAPLKRSRRSGSRRRHKIIVGSKDDKLF